MNFDNYKAQNHYLGEYYKKVSEIYKFQLNGNAIFCNYFRLIEEESTFQESTGDTFEDIGIESPLRFERIENIPLYNFSETSIPLEWNEEGGYYNSQLQIEAVLPFLPFTPKVKDYVEISYSDYKHLFRIEIKEQHTVETKTSSKLTLLPTQFIKEDILLQVRQASIFLFKDDIVMIKAEYNNSKELLKSLNALYSNYMENKYDRFSGYIYSSIVLSYFFSKYIKKSLITINIDMFDDKILTKELNEKPYLIKSFYILFEPLFKNDIIEFESNLANNSDANIIILNDLYQKSKLEDKDIFFTSFFTNYNTFTNFNECEFLVLLKIVKDTLRMKLDFNEREIIYE